MRTALAFPEPGPRPVVTVYARSYGTATTVADISTWPPTTASVTTAHPWQLVDINTPEDRTRAH